MKKSKFTMVFISLIILVTSCKSEVNEVEKIEVKHFGALRTIMSGNIKSTIGLDSLSNKNNLYALGAMENLKGEIQIFNSKPSNSFVKDNSLQINESYNSKASLLVYAEVKNWNEYKLNNITTKEDLESTIFETAKANGIDTEEPFPFLLKGEVESLDWHVINWTDGDSIHNHKKHKESGLNGGLSNQTVEILGFYSSKHKAVFTHHTTNIHMHFKTVDNTIAGHIDDLKLTTINLSLPRIKD